MSLFFIGLIIFAIISLLLFIPFTYKIDWQKNYRQQQNIDLYQQQMVYKPEPELADEFSQRLLNDEKQLQNQINYRFSFPQKKHYLPNKTNMLCFILLLSTPIGYYFSLDRFNYVLQGQQAFIEAQHQRETATSAEKNDSYIITIQNRLRQDPNNGDDWIELGQAYMLSNDFSNALKAYSNAEQLMGSKPHILGLAATALYYDSGQQITPKITLLIETALQQDLQEISSLSLLASDAFLTTNYSRALQLWQQILDSNHAGINRRSIIQSMQMAEQLQKTQQ